MSRLAAQQRRFQAAEDEVTRLYEKQRYREALAILHEAAPSFPGYRADTAHLAACLLALDGDPTAAMRELRAALHDGFWWAPRVLDDDDLASVRSLEGWEELVAESGHRAAQHQELEPVTVAVQPAGPPRGVIVVLHGAQQEALQTAADWQAAVESGFVILAVRSTQQSSPSFRTWPDQAVAARDVAAALRRVPEATTIPVIAAGFSAGGRAALLWALSADPVPVSAYVAVAPSIRLEGLPEQPVSVPGVVLLGAEDALTDQARAAVERLGPTARIEVVEGLAHDYPGDFDTWLGATVVELIG